MQAPCNKAGNRLPRFDPDFPERRGLVFDDHSAIINNADVTTSTNLTNIWNNDRSDSKKVNV